MFVAAGQFAVMPDWTGNADLRQHDAPGRGAGGVASGSA